MNSDFQGFKEIGKIHQTNYTFVTNNNLENSLSSKLFTLVEMPKKKKFWDCSQRCEAITEPGLADSCGIYSVHFWGKFVLSETLLQFQNSK